MEIDMERHSGRPNRLVTEKSPYLLQHAYNPVDWYPWGEEACAKARQENRLVFLSIGYSTCHWCHVMEKQSFENPRVAGLLNDNFVSLKVDREERPDLDYIYMLACQGLTGSGGWPLTIVMTPDLLPFYAGTYIPPFSQAGNMGMMELLPRLTKLWQQQPDQVRRAGAEVLAWMREAATVGPPTHLSALVIHQAVRSLARVYDPHYGGFGSSPKFPTPTNLLLLLQYHRRYGHEQALEMAENTLLHMYQGGLYDHIGFGFARYSTDNRWLVPHFEKMLYDNSLLAMAYLEAFQITRRPLYRQVAEDVFTYLQRDMTSPAGGFYSAQDADSEGEEGRYYLWDREEVISILGPEAGLFCATYDITEEGNFEGRNVPNLIGQPDLTNIRARWDGQREKLLRARQKRVPPFKDDKILTAWNGLMIAALALGGRVLGNPAYLQAAQQSADFLFDHLQAGGRLLSRYRDGEARHQGYAADYAYLIWGLLELYQAGSDHRILERALHLNEQLLDLFWDRDRAGLFFYGADAEPLLIRPQDSYDGALPSANAVATRNFFRLGHLVDSPPLLDRAREQLRHFSGSISKEPGAHSFWLLTILEQEHVLPDVAVP